MKIGLLGLGTIGSGIYEHLKEHGDIEVKRILELKRHPGLEHLETSDFNEILNDPEIDTVIELIGGMEPAHSFTVQAIKAGKNVVSANKLMLSHHMEEILTLAKQYGVQYRYDATVGGSIPFLYNLMRYRSADKLTSVYGIVNGTTNLILDKMQSTNASFDEVLKLAQEQGYAEANPASDIDGVDAQCKLAIASTVAFGHYADPEAMDVEGIRHISADDVAVFKSLDLVCRLLVVSDDAGDAMTAYVEPSLVDKNSTEAAVKLNNNVIFVNGRWFGTHAFQGQGAGKDPTACAVEWGLRDIMDGVSPKLMPIPDGHAQVDNARAVHAYYLRTSADPGMPMKAVGQCASGTAYLTGPMSVKDMHALAKKLREQDADLFFAGVRP